MGPDLLGLPMEKNYKSAVSAWGPPAPHMQIDKIYQQGAVLNATRLIDLVTQFCSWKWKVSI
jgi:hypothetical protein